MKITEKMKIKEKGIFWCLFGIFLTGALPLFTNYCLNASEVPYQLVRLEELQENLSAGIFRIAMPVNWQYEHGTAGLDGNLFWLLPVFLQKIGLPLESAYRCFLMCIYAAGVILSYVTFREAFRDWKLVIFSTMLYCWAPWYIDTLYGRAAIGEALGYAFLPVLLLFVVRMVGQKEGKLPQWVLLTLGTTLLLQSSFAVFIVGMLMLLHLLSQTDAGKSRSVPVWNAGNPAESRKLSLGSAPPECGISGADFQHTVPCDLYGSCCLRNGSGRLWSVGILPPGAVFCRGNNSGDRCGRRGFRIHAVSDE